MGSVDVWGGHVVGCRLPEHGRLIVSGWVVDVKARVPVKKVFAVSKGQILAVAKANLLRPDVSEVHQCDNYESCGWVLEISANALGIGASAVEIYASTSDERLVSRMARKELVVCQVAQVISDHSEAMDAIAFKRIADLRISRLIAQAGASPVATPMSCDEVLVQQGRVKVRGWALSPVGIHKVLVYLNNQFLGRCFYGHPRSDVQQKYPTIMNSLHSGFSFESRAAMPPEIPSSLITVVAIDRNGHKTEVCVP